jgi:hypothetical protein
MGSRGLSTLIPRARRPRVTPRTAFMQPDNATLKRLLEIAGLEGCRLGQMVDTAKNQVSKPPLVEIRMESIEDLGRIHRGPRSPRGAPQGPSGSTQVRSWVALRAAPQLPPFNLIEVGAARTTRPRL